jgi:hypothetical protein
VPEPPNRRGRPQQAPSHRELLESRRITWKTLANLIALLDKVIYDPKDRPMSAALLIPVLREGAERLTVLARLCDPSPRRHVGGDRAPREDTT